MPPEATKLTLLPAQKVVAPEGVTVAVGGTLTVTICEAVAVQVPDVTVTEYVPAVFTLEIVAVVAPVDHLYVPPPVAVKLTLPPEQNAVGPEVVIFAAALFETVTTCDAVDVQVPEVTVTVYVPAAVILESTAFVAPVDHK